MFESLDGHALTVIPIVAMMMVAPFYTLGVYVFSGASPKKGMQIGKVDPISWTVLEQC